MGVDIFFFSGPAFQQGEGSPFARFGLLFGGDREFGREGIIQFVPAGGPAPEPEPEPEPDLGPPAGSVVRGTGGEDTLAGGEGADTLEGFAGDDLFAPGAGADVVFGGQGTDTVLFAGPRAAHAVEPLGEGALAVTGPGGETDRVAGVERLAFDDGLLLLDGPEGDLGLLARLYAAALGRAPDAGLLFWAEALEAGGAPLAVAEAFLTSPEFAARTGAASAPLDDAAFVMALYDAVLDRPADAAGQGVWEAALAGGASRAELLLAFADSAEARAAAEAAPDGGLFLPDDDPLLL